jgi:general stress protein 26
MKKLNDEVIAFLKRQNFVIVTTIDGNGRPHSACKGIVEIDDGEKIFLIDLYDGVTAENLAKNPRMSVTAVQEHRFRGYCVKGDAKICPVEVVDAKIIGLWQDKVRSRITDRIIRNLQGEKGHPRHPEARLPKPRHLIELDVDEVVNLAPRHIREA